MEADSAQRIDIRGNDRGPELLERQRDFAALLSVEAEQLCGLKFCTKCGGTEYTWTDWTGDELPISETGITWGADAAGYREYMASSECGHCDASGFEGGSFKFTIEEWLALAKVQT